MADRKCIFAYTPNKSVPPYVNVSREEDHTFTVTVRADGSEDGATVGAQGTITMPPEEAEQMAWALARHFGIAS